MLDEDFKLWCAGADPPSEQDLAALESRMRWTLPAQYRKFLGKYGGILLEVKDEIWPRPKPFDVGPAWRFQYGFMVFGIGKDIPDWLGLETATAEFRGMLADFESKNPQDAQLIPFFRHVSSADRLCFAADGRVFEWSHEGTEPVLVDATFDEIILQETLALVDAKKRLEQEPPEWLWTRRLVNTQNPSVCLRAIEELRAQPAPGRETMAALCTASSYADTAVARAASAALVTMAQLHVSALVERLQSAKARERQEAAVCLGAMGKWAAAAVPALTVALQDIRATVSRAAAAALDKIKGGAQADSRGS